MTMNRVQFQQGMSLFELFEQFGTEAQCQAALEQARWPQGFCCPRCGSATHYVLHGSARKTFQCIDCHHQTSVIAGTLFESTKLPLPVWFLAIYLVGEAKTGLSALAFKRDLGVSHPTAWLVHHKLMQAMIQRERDYVLCGKVQVDDAYLGGELNGGTAGRGSENKVPFIGAVSSISMAIRCAKFTPVPGFTCKATAAWAADNLSPASTVVSTVSPALPASPTSAVRTSQPSLAIANPSSCRCFAGSTPSWATSRPVSAGPSTLSATANTPSATSTPLPTGSIAASICAPCRARCSPWLSSAARVRSEDPVC